MNTRGTPIRIRSRHLLDQGSNFHAHLRLPTSAPRNPGPIDPEAFSLPSDHRVRLDHVQGFSPMGPDSREHDPPRSLRAATMRIASHSSISIMEREYGGNEL